MPCVIKYRKLLNTQVSCAILSSLMFVMEIQLVMVKHLAKGKGDDLLELSDRVLPSRPQFTKHPSVVLSVVIDFTSTS